MIRYNAHPENLPDLLRKQPWLCWFYDETRLQKNGKPAKVPYDPVSHKFASTTDRTSWTDFETAWRFYKMGWSFKYEKHGVVTHEFPLAGCGLVLRNNLIGIDLDNCVQDGVIADWAQEIIIRFNTYAELSPSQTGLRLIVIGDKTFTENRKGSVEVYDYKSPRYVTMTGNNILIEGEPRQIKYNAGALKWLHEKYLTNGERLEPKTPTNKVVASLPKGLKTNDVIAVAIEKLPKFERLWNGEFSDYKSHSEADLALISQLQFMFCNDKTAVVDAFSESGLYRKKWDRKDYQKRMLKISKCETPFNWDTFNLESFKLRDYENQVNDLMGIEASPIQYNTPVSVMTEDECREIHKQHTKLKLLELLKARIQ